MIEHSEIQVGNWIQVEVENELQTRQVEHLSVERIGTKDGEKSGWFFPEEVFPIKVNDEWLKFLGFEEEASENGALTYRKGDTTFTLTYPDKNDKETIVLDCHGSHKRELSEVLYVHTLQNHFHGMTKVYIG